MEKIIQSLKSRKMSGYFVSNKEEALKKVLELIGDASTVGFGGSVTLKEIGIFDNLGNKLLDKTDPEFYYKCLSADIYLSSANALTEDGKIVNVDGRGNRVAALSFGPKKVIIIAGKNKLVKDEHAGLERIKKICIPKNLERLKSLGKDDWTADNIWCNVSIIERQRDKNRIHIIIVDEELGY